jgi:O-antigen ligase
MKISSHQNISIVLVTVFFITLLFSIPLNNITIALITLLSFTRKQFWLNLKLFYKNTNFQIFSLFLITIILSLFYSENYIYGFKVLERNATFLIFPFIMIGNKDLVNKELFDKILNSFSITVIIISLVSLIFCYYKSSGFLSLETFSRDNLISLTNLQPMYFALYISVISIIAIDKFIDAVYKKKTASILIYILILGMSLIFNILLASRMTIIALILTIVIMILLKTKKILLGLCALLVFLAISLIAIKYSPILNKRYQEISETAFQPPVGIYHNSVNLRIAHWQCAINLIKENYLIGVGIGDTQDKMNECYKSNNWSAVLYELNYNCHSQFLQSMVGMGIFGLISLLLIFCYPLYQSLQSKNYLALGFIVLFSISALTESIFLSQKAIVFFAFFMSIFEAYYQNNKISITK